MSSPHFLHCCTTAVVDDILPPAHASRAAEGAAEGSNLCQLKSRVEAHLSARHSAERMLRCWGAGGTLCLTASVGIECGGRNWLSSAACCTHTIAF